MLSARIWKILSAFVENVVKIWLRSWFTIEIGFHVLVAIFDHLHGNFLGFLLLNNPVQLTLGVKLASYLCDAVGFDIRDTSIFRQWRSPLL